MNPLLRSPGHPMNLQKLKAFRAVMLTGSVTEAASRLHLTQPAVSRSLLALADELGFKLFNRYRGRLVPTPQGEAFYREAERVLFGVDDLSRVARDIRQSKSAPLRVVAMPQLARGLVPKALAAFAKENPSVPITLEIRERRQVEQWVSGLQFDIGIVMLPLKLSGFVTRAFATLSAVAVLPRGHRLAAKEVVTFDDLVGEPLISLDRSSLLRHAVDGMFFDKGAEPNIRVETSSALVIGQMVAEGLGVSILDPFTAPLLPLDRIEVRPWQPKPQLTYGFVYPTDFAGPPFLEMFSECVVGAAKELQARFAYIEGPIALARDQEASGAVAQPRAEYEGRCRAAASSIPTRHPLR